MYIEFYGLPGTGKTTLSDLMNKSLNVNARWNYSPIAVLKATSSYSKFKFMIAGKFFTDFQFFKDVMKKPIHFSAFLKGVFVRFLVLFRHEKSGFFISDHGLVQMLSQNDALRGALLRDRNFLMKMIKLMPKQVNYVYLKTNIPHSIKRVLKREKRHKFSYEFLSECEKLFEIVKKHRKSKIIYANKSKSSVVREINTFLGKARHE
ncbi:hypothetical protein JXB27_04450 [Candidatus Woesearchaeota archaeon]|nr:hypothetical protein [Candidatus Woesearchaeota archaeon]